MIGLVTTCLQRGGAEQQLRQLAIDLAAIGEDVSVLSLMKPTAHVNALQSGGVRVETLCLQRGLSGVGLSAWSSYVRWIREREIKVGLFFNFHPMVLGRLSWKTGVLKHVVCSIRNERFGGRLRERLVRCSDGWCSVTTTNSEVAAESLERRAVVRPNTLRIVRNGVDMDRFKLEECTKEAVRRQLGISVEEFVWLSAGRLEKQKDFERLITAFGVVLERGHRGKLLIAGEGSRRDALQSLISKLGIRSSCQLLGEREDLPCLMRAADAFVLSSAWEGLPNVLIEAQVSGLPVLATNVGGVREIVRNSVSGILVTPENCEELANGLIRMQLAGTAKLRGMGVEGRDFSLSRFSRRAAFEQWLAVIRESGYEFEGDLSGLRGN